MLPLCLFFFSLSVIFLFPFWKIVRFVAGQDDSVFADFNERDIDNSLDKQRVIQPIPESLIRRVPVRLIKMH